MAARDSFAKQVQMKSAQVAVHKIMLVDGAEAGTRWYMINRESRCSRDFCA